MGESRTPRQQSFDTATRRSAQRRPEPRSPAPELAGQETKALAIAGALPGGMSAEIEELRKRVLQIAPQVNLLSPNVAPDHIPEFHSIAIRYVVVNPNAVMNEVYTPAGAKRGEVALTKVSLDRIGAAAGVTWHPTLSRRLDDGSDPHYCHFRAVGFVRDLDGSRRVITGEKEVDVREGNPQIWTSDESRMAREWDQNQNRYSDRVKNQGFVKGWSAERVGQVREHILAQAESKAKNRALRSLGIKQKYSVAELLQKPFAVLSLVLTGDHSDPELENWAKRKILEASIQTSRELYGGPALEAPPPAPPPPALEAPAEEEEPHPPPAQPVEDPDWDEVGRRADEDDGSEWSHE